MFIRAMGGGKDLFRGGHVEHSRNRYICILCKMLPVDQIFFLFSSTRIKDQSAGVQMAILNEWK